MDCKDKPKSEIAREMATYLREKVMPYWHDTAVDARNGGYILSDKPGGSLNAENTWWVQAEALAALSDAFHHKVRADYSKALDLLLDWIFRYQIISDDGVWTWSTDEEGNQLYLTKADDWKAAYHEVRAITNYIHAFLPSRNENRVNGEGIVL